jgi:hypothetical protein
MSVAGANRQFPPQFPGHQVLFVDGSTAASRLTREPSTGEQCMKTSTIRAYTRFLPVMILAGCALEGATQEDHDQTLDDAAEEQLGEDTDHAEDVSPELLDAMSRDLGIAHDEAMRLLAFEGEAARTEEVLAHELADTFAGAWLNERKDRLVVGITDSAVASRVRELGAEPLLVSRSLAELEEAKALLDQSAPDPRIHEWYVDGPTNSLVVHAQGMDASSVRALFGAQANVVTVVASKGRPQINKQLVGGDEIRNRDGRAVYTCTVGFAVQGGFVTAGHCLKKGEVIRNGRERPRSEGRHGRRLGISGRGHGLGQDQRRLERCAQGEDAWRRLAGHQGSQARDGGELGVPLWNHDRVGLRSHQGAQRDNQYGRGAHPRHGADQHLRSARRLRRPLHLGPTGSGCRVGGHPREQVQASDGQLLLSHPSDPGALQPEAEEGRLRPLVVDEHVTWRSS